jgi:hypothetical protein
MKVLAGWRARAMGGASATVLLGIVAVSLYSMWRPVRSPLSLLLLPGAAADSLSSGRAGYESSRESVAFVNIFVWSLLVIGAAAFRLTPRPPLPTREAPDSEGAPDTGPCCPHCFAPIPASAHFCPRCERPLTSFAATDPIKSILTEGQLYRGAARTTRPIVLIGMWLLCIPTLAIGVALLFEPRVVPGAAIASALCAFALYGAVLYRVTVNFVRARRGAAQRARFSQPEP